MESDKTLPARPGDGGDDSSGSAIVSAQDRSRLLIRQVNNLIELLRSQHEMLLKKGISLPPGALDNLRTFKRRMDVLSKQMVNTQVELRHLRALAGTTALINSTLETDAVLNQVMDTVINLTGAERGYIVLKDRETGRFDQFRVARGLDTAQLSVERENDQDTHSGAHNKNELIVSKTIVNRVAESGEAVLTDNASQDERFMQQASIVGFALRSIIAVPLKVRGDVIGVVYCDNRVLSGLFQPGDRDILAAFANQAGVAIDNARLFESTRRQLAQISEMRQLLDNVFDSIANGVITADAHAIVTTCNAAANQILGITGDSVGHRLADLLPELEIDLEAAVAQVQADGVQREMEVSPVLKGLGQRSWLVIISALRDAETGAAQGVALVLDDQTEKLRHEAQLAELKRYLPSALVDNFSSRDEVNLTGQEREISVIAADVRGFTSFSEKLEPETLMRVINQYLGLASDAINLYEGVVDKYMGDAVTGMFNTQLNPQQDHAMRAVRAAMSVIYDLYALHEILPEEQCLFFGIGIHTGPAYLGNVGSEDRQEFSAVGEAADVAKILEGNAKGGEIIISEATYAHVKDAFNCEERVPEKTKGRTDLTKVYKVLGRKQGTRTSPILLDPELAALLRDLDD